MNALEPGCDELQETRAGGWTNAELQETRELLKVLNQFVETYERSAPRTDALALKCAAARARVSLADCLSKATTELDRENYFDCDFCGGTHNLVPDLAALLSGNHREAKDHGTAEERARPVGDYVVLMRAGRYSPGHAKEVVRQLQLRGYSKAEGGRRKAESGVFA
jgi:hypothetical protein